MKKLFFLFTIASIILTGNATANNFRATIGDLNYKDWKGLVSSKNGISVANFNQPVSYRYPDGKRYSKGFRTIREDVSDWSQFTGLRFDVFLKDDKTVSFDVCLKIPDGDVNTYIAETHARTSVVGKGWHTIFLSWDVLEIKEGQRLGVLRLVKEISILAKTEGDKGQFKIKNIQLVKAEQVALETEIKGKSVQSGDTAAYNVEVGNTTNQTQAVQLSFKRSGWESMEPTVFPSTFELKPGETRSCHVKVVVPASIPEGAREKQVLQVITNGKEDHSLTLITASALPAPNILHTAARWQEVRDKVAKNEWAKKSQQEYVDLADKWVVPQIATKLTDDNANLGMQLFQTQEEYNFMAAGISYQLTGKKEYAEKVALFLRRLSDPETGYPKTFRACHQSFVQEGHFFQHIVMAYDMIRPSGVLSDTDTKNIEHTFRLFVETVNLGLGNGGINNWLLSEITGALYCALAVQDFDLVEKMYNGPQGIVNHLQQGIMSDGWWYECSISYNVWCASEFSQAALALEPWGIDFRNTRFPIGTSKHYSLMPEFMKPGLYGMNFEKWGTVTKNSISIKDMWDALPSFADYRGVMFGVNDAQENRVSGQPYELAYYLYKDPEYAAIVRRGDKRDLLYGVPELPETNSVLQTKSASADNMGIVMLRSQTANRPIGEQIQAALHYGTFGGYHGHFERTNLLNLSRYGRSFYNPEMIWFGYQSYLYKFLVQTSIMSNMVVVDQKMQEPVESFKTLFYTDKVMQATEVETNARWSNPPYGGMKYDWAGNIGFAEKCLQEGRTIPFPQNAPEYGAITGYTEPVLQRRLMVMLDDYVVLADYVKAESEHTYDWLFHMKGFSALTAPEKTFLRHDDQMNTDPLGSAQFITDCNWWKTKGAAEAEFSMCFGKGCDNAGTLVPNSEDGELKVNVTSAWPNEKEIMVATTPENHGVSKLVNYKISADGNVLKQGESGVWILGQVDIDVPLNGAKELKLEINSKASKNPTLFWANARVVLANGKEIALSELPLKTTNVKPTPQPGLDYFGGPIKIGGHEYKNAIPANMENMDEAGVITVDLSKLSAVRFKTVLGSDYPLGNEAARRKTFAVRSKGKTARYLTVLEPFETESVIQSVEATDANHLKVKLKDGRIQEITITGFEAEKGQTKVSVKELKDGKVIREEVTK
jgi:hypothetical protein